VGNDGTPRGLQVASPQDARLDKEAIAMVGDWRFRPGMQKGQPVEVPATLTLVHGLANRTMASSHRPD
jgi:TonB family protein